MPENYVKRTNFWENLTPLDLSHLKVFLGNFWEFFIFWIQIWILNLGRFGTGPNWNRAGPVWPVTSQTGPVPTGLVNPACNSCPRWWWCSVVLCAFVCMVLVYASARDVWLRFFSLYDREVLLLSFQKKRNMAVKRRNRIGESVVCAFWCVGPSGQRCVWSVKPRGDRL